MYVSVNVRVCVCVLIRERAKGKGEEGWFIKASILLLRHSFCIHFGCTRNAE